ncbi:Copia protein, partial [Mucuna pruriens]
MDMLDCKPTHTPIGFIFSKNNHLDIGGYIDVDWARSITDRRSTSGYFTFVGENLKVVALSNIEVEIDFPPAFVMNFFSENKVVITIVQNSIQHDHTKHVELDHHFIKQKLETNLVQFPFIKFEDQLANL